jgi:RNA ligase (TIGR02306 family)
MEKNMVAEIQDLEVPETRKLASFRLIDRIEPIEGADAIELAVVGGWKVVTKKGEFQPGDPCVYFEIDSFMPDGVPAWQFLVDKSPRIFNGVKGHKLRTVKLRGQISQGLILPVTAFYVLELVLKPELTARESAEIASLPTATMEEVLNLRYGLHEFEAALSPQDLNLNALLGIVKWEPVMSAQLAGMAEGLFPSFIRKTDQERAQNLSDEIFGFTDTVIPANEALGRPAITRYAKGDPNAKYEITMKLDGSSMTVFARLIGENRDEVETGVCSRNLQLKVNEANAENTFVKMAIDSHLLGVLHQLAEEHGIELAVQGELMGPNIQNNREELKEFRFYMFDIYDIRSGTYLPPEERRAMFDRLKAMGAKIEHVPIIAYTANLLDTLGIATMDQLLKFAEGPSIKHQVREGLVYKRVDGLFSFKTISNKYLEKEKD